MVRPISRIEGLKECREALQQLSRTVQRNVGKKSLRNGPAPVLVASVKRRAPVSSRATDPTPASLQQSVHAVDSRPEKGRATMAIVAEDPAAVPTELGLSGRNYPAQPWFRPGIDDASEAAFAAMAAQLKIEVDAAARRAAKIGARGK